MSAPSLRFIETTQASFDQKRKQLYRACDSCRRKKKRCLHTLEKCDSGDGDRNGDCSSRRNVPDYHGTTLTPSDSSTAVENQFDIDPVAPNEDAVEAGRDDVQLTDIDPSDEINTSSDSIAMHAKSTPAPASRFIGNMNPEGVFLIPSETETHQDSSTTRKIGTWSVEQRGQPRRRPMPSPHPSLFHGFKPAIQTAVLPILEEECLSTIPPAAHRKALSVVYFENFHPLLPIVNKSAYDSLPAHSSSRLLLDQGICLVAAMDSSSKDHLFLSNDLNVLRYADFGHRLFAAMRMYIEMGRVVDRVLLVQLLALMSLFTEGPSGYENSLLMLGRAVQHLHSLGFHLRMEEEHEYCEHAETLFSCVWFLDRLSAASQGRPVQMHERDISRSMRQSFEAQDPPFRLLLRVGLLLDEVVKLYRPECTSTEFIHDFVLFEDLAVECRANRLSPHLLVTIEVFYHAVAILSCHHISDGLDRQIPPSRRTRQSWSAERATALVGHEFLNQLVLLPFVPYAVSLSLSVNYRQLRRSKLSTHRARARTGLEDNCQILEQLGDKFGSAAIMAEMGSVTLKELDRVCINAKDDALRRALDHVDPAANTGSNHGQETSSVPARVEREASMAFPQDFDIFCFSDLSNLDPFELFDPTFDLNSVDAFLQRNLDPAVPM